MNFIKKLFFKYFMPHSRVFWGLLFLGFAYYEGCGLFFQYVMKLNPCVECVYERAAFLFFGVAAILGVCCPRIIFGRLLATLIWVAASIKGLMIAVEHRSIEVSYNAGDMFGPTCSLFPEFPDWFKLDVWLPEVFASTGLCGETVWTFLGYTMVQWIELIFWCNTVVAVLFVLLCFIPTRVYDQLVVSTYKM